LNFYTKLSALARGEKITKILDLLMYVLFNGYKISNRSRNHAKIKYITFPLLPTQPLDFLLYQVECIGSRGKNYENIRPFNVCDIFAR
jgi:hypothetical protein